MRRKAIHLKIEDLKAIVRGRTTLEKVIGSPEDFDGVPILCKESFQITMEDVVTALEYFKANNISATLICEDWFYGLNYILGDIIGLPAFLGVEGTAEDIELYILNENCFFKNEQELALYIFERLYEMDEERFNADDETQYCMEVIADLLEIIKQYPENKDKPYTEWRLTRKQMKDYLYYYADEKDLAEAPVEEKEAYKKILLELADQDDAFAVKTLGYAYYGNDNPVFPCDWEKSRDCMLRLMEIDSDRNKAQAANTLGYIYYYGRVNNGVPQYEEAYKYFSLAAFYGFYEAVYKVGDMIRDGKGTFKNEEAAFRMYSWVYDDNYLHFLQGRGEVLSDAALRIGSCYKNGVGVRKNLMLAYRYYLIAKVSVEERMRSSNFFGLSTVAANINSGLSELRKELGKEVMEKSCKVYPEMLLKQIVFANGVTKAQMTVREKKTGYSITIETLCNDKQWSIPKMLLVFPEISYCHKSNEVKLFIPKEAKVETITDDKTFEFDNVKMKKGELHLYYKKKLVFSTDASTWIIKADRKTGSKVLHKFASVQFVPGGRTYDYLCDGMDIKEGDDIVIPGMNGEQVVKAVRVYEQPEMDMALELEKYKKVISVVGE